MCRPDGDAIEPGRIVRSRARVRDVAPLDANTTIPRPMRTSAVRLRSALVLVLLAWFAQLCLPVAHAAIMSSPRAQLLGWCGDPSGALAIAAELPAEIREGLGLDGLHPDHLSCAQLCATGTAPPTTPVATTVALRAAGIEPAPTRQRLAPRTREQALTPPSHGPPAHA